MTTMNRSKLIIYFFIFFAFVFPDPTHSLDVLPDTGQTKCYDVGNEIPCPAQNQSYYGQDGNYHGLQPAYQLSADSLIVSDLNTCRMWQQGSGISLSWINAISYCDNLTLGGFSDWRLPSRMELVSIVDYSRNSPSINSIFECQSSGYWTAISNNSTTAWVVNFSRGEAENYASKSVSHCIRCVRGGP